MMQREFLQLYSCSLDKLETLSVFAETISARCIFRQRAKMVVERALAFLRAVL